jgi:hypothetical protein
MLSPISSNLSTRTGRSQESEFRGRAELQPESALSRKAAARPDVVSRFREILRSQHGQSRPVAGRSANSQTANISASRNRHSVVLAGPSRGTADPPPSTGLIAASYSRGASAASKAPQGSEERPALPDMGLPMQSTYQGPPIDEKAGPPLHPVYKVPMVQSDSLNAYIHPLQRLGSVVAGDGSAGEIAASNVYHVPSWGLQDFVTSDGFRHRFDVEVVFGPGSAWVPNGQPRPGIHPEVSDFVLESLRQELQKAGVPVNAIASMNTMRMHGGTQGRTWHLDQVEVVSADGRKLHPTMNSVMRDPRYTVELIQEFLAEGAIPT